TYIRPSSLSLSLLLPLLNIQVHQSMSWIGHAFTVYMCVSVLVCALVCAAVCAPFSVQAFEMLYTTNKSLKLPILSLIKAFSFPILVLCTVLVLFLVSR